MNYIAILSALSANRAHNCREAKVAPLMLAQAIVVYIEHGPHVTSFVTVSVFNLLEKLTINTS